MPSLEGIIQDLQDALKKQEEQVKQQQELQAKQLAAQQQNQQNQPQQGASPPQGQQQPNIEEIIKSLPAQQQQVFLSLLKTDPSKAMEMIQQVMGQGGEQPG
jgi:hypothetical protein